MASPDPKKELWVGWTRDALARYEEPDKLEDNDELVDDMVDLATKYADSMLDEYEERFEKTARSTSRRKRKTADEDED